MAYLVLLFQIFFTTGVAEPSCLDEPTSLIQAVAQVQYHEPTSLHTAKAGVMQNVTSQGLQQHVSSLVNVPISLNKSSSKQLSMMSQPGDVEYESFGTRMMNSFGGVLIGIILIVLSVPCIALNERRQARMQSLLALGEEECREVTGSKVDTDNRGCLVSVTDGNTRPLAMVDNKAFDVHLKCVALKTSVELYQWVEHEHKREEDQIGGGKVTITTYSYTEEWKAQNPIQNPNDRSKTTQAPDKWNNTFGVTTTYCERVEYGNDDGSAFVLPEDLLRQLEKYQPAEQKELGPAVEHAASGEKLSLHDKYYYLRNPGGNPQIGDVRVKFDYLAAGGASILALQVEKKGDPKDTFQPYRLVARGCCCCRVEEDKLKEDLIAQANKSADELAEEDTCKSGPLAVLCCCCNLIAYMHAYLPMLRVEIFDCEDGQMAKIKQFEKVRTEATLVTWVMRLVGFLVMLIGFEMVFDPVVSLLYVIPWLAYLGGFLIWLVALILSLALTSLIVFFAYLWFRPITAMVCLSITTALVVVPIVIVNSTKHQ